MSNLPYQVAALYKFIDLPNFAEFRDPLLQFCKAHEVCGTLLLAHEGINGTIAGNDADIARVIAWLEGQTVFQGIDVKYSRAESMPFYRMKVRLKKEIVTLGVESVDAANNAGTYVEPADWNALIEQDDVIVIDTRNDYEVAIGTFERAQNPHTQSFREFPKWVDEKLSAAPNAKIAMFCTGGIRCEKSTALLKSKGFDDVYHLKGGILKYLETVSEEESRWQGECFVFDHRVSVKHGLEQGDYGLCHACRMPLSQNEMRSEHYVSGVSCPHCHDTISPHDRERFQERQKQVELAASRNTHHLAADVGAAKRAKKQENERLRALSRSKG